MLEKCKYSKINVKKNYRKIGKKMIMRWMMMWLNWSVATINAMLQLLDIYRLVSYTQNQWVLNP